MQPKSFRIFVQSPNSQFRTLTIDPTPSLTLHDLKRNLFPDDDQALMSSLYFTHNGKPLHDSTRIPCSQIAPLSTLILRSRLLGGGGDGGATGAESRDCYLNMYAVKKPDKVDPNEQRLSKWLNCALSNEPLRQPCVIDRLGNVFNKESLVEALINKRLPKHFSYIKGLKDMINVKLEPVPGGEESGSARFQCPVTGLEFNGKYRFFALRKCGHVLSAKALKEVKSSACLVCYKEFEETDKVVINGSEEEVDALREKMEEERTNAAKDKKPKKVKNGQVGVVSGGGDDGVAEDAKIVGLTGKKHGILGAKDAKKIVGKADRTGKDEHLRGASDGGVVKRFKAADMLPANANKEVYASIFTSSKKSDFKETFTCRSLPLGRN